MTDASLAPAVPTGTTSPRQISFGTADFRPDVAWNGSNYLVVFEEQFAPNPSDVDILAQRVDRNGTLVGSNFGIITTTAGQGQPAISGTSTGFSVAWNDNRNGNWDVYAARLSPTGVVQDAGGKRLSNEATFARDEFFPDLAWNGTSTMVVWQALDVGEYILRTGRLFADGTPEQVHNGAFRLGHDYQKAAIASDGSRWLVVFEDKTRSTGAVDILGFHLTSDGFHNGTFPISTIGGNEGDPAVAYNGGTFLVVLTDRRFTNDPDIRAIRFNRSAARLDSDSIWVESAANENDMPACLPGGAAGGASPTRTARGRRRPSPGATCPSNGAHCAGAPGAVERRPPAGPDGRPEDRRLPREPRPGQRAGRAQRRLRLAPPGRVRQRHRHQALRRGPRDRQPHSVGVRRGPG